MVQTVWLHIGTPKSGTSSLQKYLMQHRDALSAHGLAYLVSPGRNSCNDIAIGLNRGRADLLASADVINAEIETRSEEHALISSEMFYGMSPQTLLDVMPALRDRPLKILVYLRRQDRYIESMFLQKSKNGRFFGSIADYIAKFDGSGSDYAAMLADWQDQEGATVVPRILEWDRLAGGSVVSDVLHLLGIRDAPAEDAEDVNVSPGYHRVQLLQLATAVDIADPRKLQRRLANKYPQKPEERGAILGVEARVAFLAQYADGNRKLADAYFEGQKTLFDESDLSNTPKTGVAPFSEDQLVEIKRFLETIKSLQRA